MGQFFVSQRHVFSIYLFICSYTAWQSFSQRGTIKGRGHRVRVCRYSFRTDLYSAPGKRIFSTKSFFH